MMIVNLLFLLGWWWPFLPNGLGVSWIRGAEFCHENQMCWHSVLHCRAASPRNCSWSPYGAAPFLSAFLTRNPCEAACTEPGGKAIATTTKGQWAFIETPFREDTRATIENIKILLYGVVNSSSLNSPEWPPFLLPPTPLVSLTCHLG